MLALADLVASAALVAVTVTVCADTIVAGAVYSPAAVTLPTPLGEMLQLSCGLLDPVTVAVNCNV